FKHGDRYRWLVWGIPSACGGHPMGSKSRRSAPASVIPFPSRRRMRGSRIGKDQLVLDTVLNNMSQGVLMFDADTRLVFSNRRYVEMYGLSPETAKPGCSLLELLGHHAAVGAFGIDPKDYMLRLLKEMATGTTMTDLVKASDGRVFSVTHKPMPD